MQRLLEVLVSVAVMAGVCLGDQLYLGDDCDLADGGAGICKRALRCAAAKHTDLRTCFMERGLPVVCCPRATPPRSTATPPRSTATPPRSTATPPSTATTPPSTAAMKPAARDRRVGAVSAQKCQEYGKAVYVDVDTGSFPFGLQTTQKADCAQTSTQLIVGGVKCLPKEFPHMALLGYGEVGSEKWLCGGSLISDRYVLTAAHCLFSRTAGKVRWAALGDLNVASAHDEARPLRAQVASALAAPGYAHGSHYHDIALLRMRRRVVFNAFVRPACLHADARLAPGLVVTATGWGVLDWTDEQQSQDLMKVDLLIQPASSCNVTFATLRSALAHGFLEDSMICAGDPEKHRDTCVGDSGGPLQVAQVDPFCTHAVLGVTSFGGRGCGSGNAVYTRVAHYLGWIESVVWPPAAAPTVH